MPLTACPDCHRQISTIAVACPGCGRPTRQIEPGQPGEPGPTYGKAIAAATLAGIVLTWLSMMLASRYGWWALVPLTLLLASTIVVVSRVAREPRRTSGARLGLCMAFVAAHCSGIIILFVIAGIAALVEPSSPQF